MVCDKRRDGVVYETLDTARFCGNEAVTNARRVNQKTEELSLVIQMNDERRRVAVFQPQ